MKVTMPGILSIIFTIVALLYYFNDDFDRATFWLVLAVGFHLEFIIEDHDDS